MQAIKGLLTLLLVAAAVFTAVMIFNNKMESADEAAASQPIRASADKPMKQAAVGKTSGADTHQDTQKSNL